MSSEQGQGNNKQMFVVNKCYFQGIYEVPIIDLNKFDGVYVSITLKL